MLVSLQDIFLIDDECGRAQLIMDSAMLAK